MPTLRPADRRNVCARAVNPGRFDTSHLNLTDAAGSSCSLASRKFALASVALVGAASVLALWLNVSDTLSALLGL